MKVKLTTLNQILGVLYLHFWPCMYNFGPVWISKNLNILKFFFFVVVVVKDVHCTVILPQKKDNSSKTSLEAWYCIGIHVQDKCMSMCDLNCICIHMASVWFWSDYMIYFHQLSLQREWLSLAHVQFTGFCECIHCLSKQAFNFFACLVGIPVITQVMAYFQC